MAEKCMGNLLLSSKPPSSPSTDDAPTEDEDLSDRALREKIELLESEIDSGLTKKLPDKGIKLYARLDALRQQLNRKRKLQDHAEGEKSDVSPRQAVFPSKSTDYFLMSPPSNQSLKTPISCFPRKIDSKADDVIHDKDISSSNDTVGSSMLNQTQLNEADMPSRTPLKSCSSSAIKNDGINSYSGSGDRRVLTRSAKRRKKIENHLARHGEWAEVRAVVLLDEDDELPITTNQERRKLDKWKDMKIHYPSRDHPQSVEICYSDVKSLDPQSFLSSTIMNFYIQYLQNTIPPSCRLGTECHFFNTYFYKKLEEAVCCKVDRSATFSKLRRWLKGVNIFQKAYIFLPVHGDLHWSLVIICIPAQEDDSGPIVLHLDSLGFHDGNRIFKSIESYLREEWEHICRNVPSPDLPISEKVWAGLPRKIQRRKITVPQQKNDYDCGLFVLYFIQRFIEDAPERLKKKNLAMFGSKWFLPEEASELRRRIRTLLLKEFEKVKDAMTEVHS